MLAPGGIVSVALSLGLPRVAVSNHLVLELFGLSSPKNGAIACLLAQVILPDYRKKSSIFTTVHRGIR